MSSRLMNHRFLGVVFIGLLVLGIWLVNAVFTQKFTPFDDVSLRTDNIGLQLPARADVKIRGVIIGQVLKATPGKPGDGAVLTLGIDPGKIAQVPRNVTATILPKTLFGEKYVELNIPRDAAATSLRAGESIAQTKLPIEVEKVLNDLYPLLRTIQPAELNYTLNALATALEGRGKELGENIVTFDNYLKRINPQVPALIADLKLLSKVSATYAGVVPQLAATLRNTVKTGNTLVSRQAKLHQFLRDTASFSDTAKSFLNANGDNIIRLGQLSAPQLALLSRYSPEYPCLLRGIVGQAPRLGSTFRGFIFHIQLITLPKQPRGYNAGDLPVYGDSRAPSCAGLPHPSGSPAHPYQSPNFNDGASGLGKGDGNRAAPGFARKSVSGAAQRSAPGSAQPTGLTAGTGGTQSQKDLINALVAPVLGIPVTDVPDLTSLLFAPLAAGTEVSVR